MVLSNCPRWLARVATAALTLAASVVAQAQPAPPAEGFDAHGFVLAAHDFDLRDTLMMQRPGRFEQWEWFAGGVFEYAKSPLVLQSDDTGDRVVVLDNIFAANLSTGVAVHEYVRFDALIPLYFTSTGRRGNQGVGFGDIRLASMVAILRPDAKEGGWGLGVVPHLDLPSGNDAEFLGQTNVAGGITAAVTHELERATVGGTMGLQFNPNVEVVNISGSDAFQLGLGAGYLVTDEFGVNGELRAAIATRKSPVVGSTAPAELIISGRNHPTHGGFVSGGLSAALTSGAGAAAFRLFVGGGFGKQEAPVDNDLDKDGIVNKADDCPEEPETVNGFLDEDGCPDFIPTLTVDVLYKTERVSSADLRVTGPDGAKDIPFRGELYTREIAPDTEWSAEAFTGCLAGRASGSTVTGDIRLNIALAPAYNAIAQYRVRDLGGEPVLGVIVRHVADDPNCGGADLYELPPEGTGSQYVGPGGHEVIVTAPGFKQHTERAIFVDGEAVLVDVVLDKDVDSVVAEKPPPPATGARVRIERTKIVILDPIHFESGSARIAVDSHRIIDEVAAAVLQSGKLGRVEVAGHTDSQGSDTLNDSLSQKRAQAVVDYLISKGVASKDLVAKGYGERQPITTNRTPSGRAKNRRVDFNLIDR